MSGWCVRGAVTCDRASQSDGHGAWLDRAGVPGVHGTDGDVVAVGHPVIAVDQGLGQRAENLKVDGCEGGRLQEVLQDGSTRDWGESSCWQPPHRVVYSWKPNDDPTPPTEVELRFIPEETGRS